VEESRKRTKQSHFQGMASPSSPIRLTSDHGRDDVLSEPVYHAADDADRLAITASQLAENNSIVSQALSQRNTIDELLGRGDGSQQTGTFVWGTTINTAETLRSIWLFFTSFKKNTSDLAPYYVQLIEKVRGPEWWNFWPEIFFLERPFTPFTSASPSLPIVGLASSTYGIFPA
jgi:hypothetical protein